MNLSTVVQSANLEISVFLNQVSYANTITCKGNLIVVKMFKASLLFYCQGGLKREYFQLLSGSLTILSR